MEDTITLSTLRDKDAFKDLNITYSISVNMPGRDIVQEEWDRLQDEINRLNLANRDLLADSKRHEVIAMDRLRILKDKYPDSERLLVTEVARLRKNLALAEKGLRNADKYIRLLGTHLLSKRLGKLGLHQNNQKSFQDYKNLIDKLDSDVLLYPPRTGNYSQRILKPKHIYKFEEYMKSNWRDSYTKCIDHYSRTQVKWRT